MLLVNIEMPYVGAGDRGSGLVEPSGSRGLRSDEAEDGKCAHGVGDTGSTFQAPGKPRAPAVNTINIVNKKTTTMTVLLSYNRYKAGFTEGGIYR